MKLKLNFVGFSKKEEIIEVDGKKRYSDILEELGINPETVVLVRDSLPLPIDDFVEEGEVKVIRVISGG
ncbi:MAG: MoaD/ThiS family protein [Archaeoglobaceae archaeon]